MKQIAFVLLALLALGCSVRAAEVCATTPHQGKNAPGGGDKIRAVQSHRDTIEDARNELALWAARPDSDIGDSEVVDLATVKLGAARAAMAGYTELRRDPPATIILAEVKRLRAADPAQRSSVVCWDDTSKRCGDDLLTVAREASLLCASVEIEATGALDRYVSATVGVAWSLDPDGHGFGDL